MRIPTKNLLSRNKPETEKPINIKENPLYLFEIQRILLFYKTLVHPQGFEPWTH